MISSGHAHTIFAPEPKKIKKIRMGSKKSFILDEKPKEKVNSPKPVVEVEPRIFDQRDVLKEYDLIFNPNYLKRIGSKVTYTFD